MNGYVRVRFYIWACLNNLNYCRSLEGQRGDRVKGTLPSTGVLRVRRAVFIYFEVHRDKDQARGGAQVPSRRLWF